MAAPLPLPLAAAGWELNAALSDGTRSASAPVDEEAALLGLSDRLTVFASVTDMFRSTAFCLAPAACLTASAVPTSATRRASCDSVIALPSRLHAMTCDQFDLTRRSLDEAVAALKSHSYKV